MTIAERLEQKGRQAEAQKIAMQLLKMGMSPETVKQATGLSDKALKKLRH
ncbi:Rpn family recombination-promoting nuclease/putative transposase [Citrobacter koseri]|nr:Rpn family recombination-promoting nuclease/putative transposase [Enterobacter cloacae]MBH0128484.1 Rpn family recombination-promoting nuclease/putative transposase [Enterobacter sp. SECR18-0236]MBJ9306430.1 Rpn family recombination-promoting nuclease/putative transposase [Citrobacter koseri]HBM0951595.1 Rpn family recombination-promoting nuclease/putative transposase [Enterobacter kobei]MBJ9370367.1 Rpn family recombination-promoting nuclease/putative transposase [Citrobacter koseri]